MIVFLTYKLYMFRTTCSLSLAQHIFPPIFGEIRFKALLSLTNFCKNIHSRSKKVKMNSCICLGRGPVCIVQTQRDPFLPSRDERSRFPHTSLSGAGSSAYSVHVPSGEKGEMLGSDESGDRPGLVGAAGFRLPGSVVRGGPPPAGRAGRAGPRHPQAALLRVPCRSCPALPPQSPRRSWTWGPGGAVAQWLGRLERLPRRWRLRRGSPPAGPRSSRRSLHPRPGSAALPRARVAAAARVDAGPRSRRCRSDRCLLGSARRRGGALRRKGGRGGRGGGFFRPGTTAPDMVKRRRPLPAVSRDPCSRCR